MLACGECRETFNGTEERENHRKNEHQNSPGFGPGGFCALCDDLQVATLFNGHDHLIDAHWIGWKKMIARVERTYEINWNDFPCQYTIAKAAFSRRRGNRTALALEKILTRIDTLSDKFDDDDDDGQQENTQAVADAREPEDSNSGDEDHQQLQQHYETVSQLLDQTPSADPLPWSNLYEGMPAMTSMLNNGFLSENTEEERAPEEQKSDEVSRKRGNVETTSSNEPPESVQKRPRPLEIPPGDSDMRTAAFPTPPQDRGDTVSAFTYDSEAAKVVEDDDDISIVRVVKPKKDRKEESSDKDISHGIKIEVDAVTAFPDLPPPAEFVLTQTQPLHVQTPSTPVSSLPAHVAMLTPESSVHTQPDDDVMDQKPPQNPTATAHFAEGELDERKFMHSASPVSTSSASGAQFDLNQGFNMQSNQFSMVAGNAQLQALNQLMNQSMAAPPMANQFLPPAAHAAPTAPVAQFMPITEQQNKTEFWERNEPGQCPICGEFIAGKSLTKRNHFRKFHYLVYFSKVRIVHAANGNYETLQRFLGMRLGAENGDKRMCLWCNGGSSFAIGRCGLITHMQQDHPQAFRQFCCEYRYHWSQISSEPFGAVPPDVLIHNIVMRSDDGRYSTGTPSWSQ